MSVRQGPSVPKFAHFKGLHLFFMSNFPEAAFIQGTTSILYSKLALVKKSFSVMFSKLDGSMFMSSRIKNTQIFGPKSVTFFKICGSQCATIVHDRQM